MITFAVVKVPQDVARGTILSCPLTVQAWPVAAAVQLLFTVGAGVIRRASAGVASGHRLHTGAAVKTGTVCTRHGNDLTVLPIESLRASAGVVVLQVLWIDKGKHKAMSGTSGA